MAAAGLLWGLLPAQAPAQIRVGTTTEIDFDRAEAWAMKYFASVSMSSALGSPRPLRAGEIDLSLEYLQVPSLSAEERRVGFVGTKVEDLNKTPYALRPVAYFGLGRKLTLSAGYVPPVEKNGVEPSILTLAIGRPVHEGDGWRLGLRLHGQIGTVEGDFTCSQQTVAAGEDPQRNPFECEAVSEDEYEVRTIGLEVSAAWELGREGRWEPYAALSLNHMDLEFLVDAQYSGLLDRTRLVTDGETWSAALGVGYRFSERWSLAAEVFYTPLDVIRHPSTTSQTDELVQLRAQLTYKVK